MELPKDRPDDLDRIQSPAAQKLLLLCQWCVTHIGRDPRGGGISFVAIPRVIEAIWNELPPLLRKLGPVVVVGARGGDVVFHWEGVPFCVRDIDAFDPRAKIVDADLSSIRNVNLRAVLNSKLERGELASTMPDRRIAGEMRFRAARGLPMLPPIEAQA